MAHDLAKAIGAEEDGDLELLEFLEADLLPDGAQSGFKAQLRSYLREMLRERGTIPARDPQQLASRSFSKD